MQGDSSEWKQTPVMFRQLITQHTNMANSTLISNPSVNNHQEAIIDSNERRSVHQQQGGESSLNKSAEWLVSGDLSQKKHKLILS